MKLILIWETKKITGVVKGVADCDVVNKLQLNEIKSNFNSQLNNTIAEHGYSNSLICVFYLDNNQFNNGDKISKLPDKKSFFPSYDANQNTKNRKPTADDDLNFSYLYFREKQCLTVGYNLNGKNNLNVFIVFRILDTPNLVNNGIFGNNNSGASAREARQRSTMGKKNW